MSNISFQASNKKPGFRVVSYVFLVLFVVLIAILLFVSYATALSFLLGIFLALLIILLLTKLWKGHRRGLFIGISVTAVVFVTLLYFYLSRPALMSPCTPGATLDFKVLKDYHATIEPEDFSAGSFRVAERAFYDFVHRECLWGRVRETILEQNVSVLMPERQIHSTPTGFI